MKKRLTALPIIRHCIRGTFIVVQFVRGTPLRQYSAPQRLWIDFFLAQNPNKSKNDIADVLENLSAAYNDYTLKGNVKEFLQPLQKADGIRVIYEYVLQLLANPPADEHNQFLRLRQEIDTSIASYQQLFNHKNNNGNDDFATIFGTLNDAILRMETRVFYYLIPALYDTIKGDTEVYTTTIASILRYKPDNKAESLTLLAYFANIFPATN